MGSLAWIPGIGHWMSGQKGRAFVVGALFLTYIAIGAANASAITDTFARSGRWLGGATIPFAERHADFLVASLFLFAMLIGLVLFSGLAYRRWKAAQDAPAGPPQGQWSIVWRQFKKNKLGVAGAAIILALYMAAFMAPFIATHDPDVQGHRVKERLLEPSKEHFLGTDRFARDFFSRIVYGARISLLVGLLSVAIAVTIGTVYGAVAGYYSGRWVDGVMMRFVDLMMAFPTLILIITIIAVWRKQSIWISITIIGLTSWMGLARLVRGEFLTLKELDWFQAARGLGATPSRLIFVHLLPNAMTPIIIASTLRVGAAILTEASLSFLGLGVQPPTPSWGNMVLDAKGNIFTEWWLPLSAGLAIVITVVGYNLLGDALRDSLDPRLRR